MVNIDDINPEAIIKNDRIDLIEKYCHEINDNMISTIFANDKIWMFDHLNISPKRFKMYANLTDFDEIKSEETML